MISTMGYRASNSPPYGKTQFELGLASPLQLSSSLFVASRRPSILLSLTLLHFPTSPTRRTASSGHISAPIDLLPVEILCDIFSICDETPGNQLCGSKVTLSHVCRRWRGVVLCMPVLWSRISVQKPNRTSVERVTAHFRRSGSYPISLTIVETTASSSEQHDAISCLLSLINSHASQLKSVHLRLRTSVANFVAHLSACQFSRLEDLDLHLHCSTSLAEDLVSLFQQGSRLSSLVWRRANNLPTNISWATLTRVQLKGSYQLDTVYTILRQCRDLQELNLDCVEDGPSLAAPLELPALRHLVVHTHVSLSNLLRGLQAPSLRTAYIHHRMGPSEPRGWDAFSAFLVRSGCSLEKFVLWDKGSDDSQLIQCLQLPGLQSLKDLDIQQPHISDDVLSLLSHTRGGDGGSVLPHLAAITLADCRTSDGVLRDFVASRLTQGVFTSIEIGLVGIHFKDETYLKSLQPVDIKVHVHR